MKSIDLNADLGEGADSDSRMIALVSSANISCGAHAGGEDTVRAALQRCLESGVAIGAHPGYSDPEAFGRRPLVLGHAELRGQLLAQLEWFARMAEKEGAQVSHIKPHGALYLQADRSAELAVLVVSAVVEVFPKVAWFSPWRGCLAAAATDAGLLAISEGFADRRYLSDGNLAPRNLPHAVIHEPEACARQAERIALHQLAATIDGGEVHLRAQTLCLHGDGDDAVLRLQAVRQLFHSVDRQICPPFATNTQKY